LEKQNYKPIGKCKYSGVCTFYNFNFLPSEVEQEMCGKGVPTDKDYIPWFPKPKSLNSTKEFPFEMTGESIMCEAFGYLRDSELIFNLENHVLHMKKEIDKRKIR